MESCVFPGIKVATTSSTLSVSATQEKNPNPVQNMATTKTSSSSVLCLLSLVVLAVSLLTMEGVGGAHIQCASCDEAKCVPPPPGCELGRRPCNCCLECRVRQGGQCGPFTAECESHLVCHTIGGQMFVGRPPVDAVVSGRCVPRPEVPTPYVQLQRGIRL